MDLSSTVKGVLFNPEIISTIIFTQLGLSDLKNVRLVCQKWRMFGWCHLIQNPNIGVRFDNGDKKLNDYFQFFQNTKTPPLKNYILSNEFKNAELLTKFYETFGPHMRYLDISKCVPVFWPDHTDQRNVGTLEHFAFNCMEMEFPIAPELILEGEDTYLEIHATGSVPTREVMTELGAFLRQNRFMLKRLRFNDEQFMWHYEDDPPHDLIQIIADAGFIRLESLDLCGYLDDQCILALASANLTVKILKISLNDHSPESLTRLMNTLNDTLEHLTLGSYKFTFKNENLVFPRMTLLKTLRIDKFEGSFAKLSRRYLPNLESLHISRMRAQEDDSRADSSNKLKNCRICLAELEHSIEEVEITIANLGKVFPNIQNLFIRGKVADEYEGQIMQMFPNLKKLTLAN